MTHDFLRVKLNDCHETRVYSRFFCFVTASGSPFRQLGEGEYGHDGKQAGESYQAEAIEQGVAPGHGAGEAEAQCRDQRHGNRRRRDAAGIIGQRDDHARRKYGLHQDKNVSGNDVPMDGIAYHNSITAQRYAHRYADGHCDSKAPSADRTT